MLLDPAGEVDLQAPRHLDAVVALQQVGDAALARLRVHADDRLVAAAQIGRIDRQVRHPPREVLGPAAARFGPGAVLGEALLDCILVCAGERRVHQLPDIGMARMDVDAVAVLHDPTDVVDVGEVDHGIDALRVEVQRQRRDVDVAGALAVPEDAALDALGAGQHREFRARDAGAAVVVRVHGQDDRRPSGEVPVHVLDLIRVHVRRRRLDGRRQVQDHRSVLGGVPESGHGVAEFQRVVGLRQVEHLG